MGQDGKDETGVGESRERKAGREVEEGAREGYEERRQGRMEGE